MIAEPPICTILEENGLDACANFIRTHINEIDLKLFLELLCSPNHNIHIPLACIFHNIYIPENDISGVEMDQLLQAIEVFQEMKQLSDNEIGRILDHILNCHLKNQVIFSTSDFTRIFSLLQSSNSSWILDLFTRSGSTFWYELFNRWAASYGVGWVTPQVVDLLRSADVQGLQDVLKLGPIPEKIQEFFEDLELIQTCSYFLLNTDWQRIIGRQTRGNLAILHAAVLGRCFLNWLQDMDPEGFESNLPVEIASVVMALVQDKNWRFRDVEKLFRFSKRPEDLPWLLGVLTQIQEGNLNSGALDRMPTSGSTIADLEGMLENNREFQPPTEMSRTDAIRTIANSDFNQYNHSEALVTERNLTQMMSDFDDSYNNSGSEFANEAKAITAVEKFFGVKMRDVQILGVLLAVKARRANVSRLVQMQTGEGKTYVIAALAIAEVLNGNNVDIITSSETLATTQTAELKDLYASVDITVRHNCDDDRKGKETSKVYEANVVYGTAASFMFDVLYEEFWGSKIRCGRGFPVVIVDEVDAQMLDNANHVCQFASSASGMGNLLGIQAAVWMLVSQNFQDIQSIDGLWKVNTDNGTVDINDVGVLKQYFKDGLTDALEKIAGFQDGAKEEEKVKFPKTLHEFCKRELPLWLRSAVDAILKKLDFEYCIEDDRIVIVDSARSGTRNRGSRWSYGLHQFLEMRHATKLSPENLTMCFLSTMSFCRRYKTNVIGLTGTVGGAASRKFLNEVYNVDFVEIPPFMVWRHIVLPHIFCDNTNQWLQTVTDKTLSKLNEGRACLVITQYIHFAEVLCREIGARNSGKTISYTGGGGLEDISGKIAPGTCIVATNVAGRGTDFKISESVEKAGGLHVMLTSLPENDRVERQNIGRSSRSGQPGTSQMILNMEQVDAYFLDEMVRRSGEGASHTTFVNTLREVRDDWVMQCVDNWIGQMETIQRSDTALTEFISMRNDLIDRYKDYYENAKDEDKSYMQMYMESALNIRFGIYLATNHSALEPDKIQEDFNDLPGISEKANIPKCFSDYVYPIYASWNLKWNPEKEPDEFHLAQSLLSRAVELDPEFAGAAYYIRAYSFLKCYQFFEKTDYIMEAMEDLKHSRTVVQRLLDQYQFLLLATKKKNEDKTKIGAQTERLMAMCGFIMSNIDVLIGRHVDEDLTKIRKMIEEMNKKGEDASEMEKQMKDLEDNRGTLEKGVLKEIADDGAELEVKEHRLKDMLPENINLDDFKEEISHFENEGYFRLISVKKREKINWWNVIGVALLGILQIVGGALLAVYTGGAAAAFGVGLMVGGCFDIFTAVKSGIIDRDFSWEAYGLEKLFDLATSAVTAGLSGMKNAAKGISAGVKSMAKVGTSQVAKEALKHGAKHAGKAAVLVGAKITANEVFNATAAGPMKQAVANLLTDEIKKVLSNAISDNSDLHHIVDVDNHHNSRSNSSEFVNRATDHFLKQFSPEFLERLAKSIGDGLKGNQAIGKGVKAAVSATSIGIVISKISEHIKQLPWILQEVAAKADSGGNERHDDRVYENKGELNVDSVIKSLASNISDFCATKAVSKTANFFSSKISNMIVNKTFKKTDEQLAHFKKAFITSEDVAKRARNSMKNGNKEDKAVLNTIAEVAENHNKPGDRLQAKYLADIVQAPIEIEYKDGNGNNKLIVYGSQFSKNPPIRLKFEQGVNGQPGHYSFADGTHAKPSGRNTCLFDTVSQVTKYQPHELKRAAANFMLNDLDRVKFMYMKSSYADLLVGGVRKRGTLTKPRNLGPQYSDSAIKHVDIVETVNDVLKKANTTQSGRKRPMPTNTVIDHDLEKFDDKADAGFDSWLTRNPTAKPAGRKRNVQCDYLHDESNIYKVQYSSPRRQNPISIDAYRGEPMFKVEQNDGAVHFDHRNTTQKTPTLTIWNAGDPTNVRLADIFADHFPL